MKLMPCVLLVVSGDCTHGIGPGAPLVCCRQVMEYVNNLAPGPLGGAQADQKLAAAWVDKLEKWDGRWVKQLT